MNCREFQDRLAPFLEGVLPERERREAEAHLRSCPRCRELYERARVVPLRAPRSPAPGEDFWRAMDEALAREATRPPTASERLSAWLHQPVSLSRGAALVYGLLLLLSWWWALSQRARAPERQPELVFGAPPSPEASGKQDFAPVGFHPVHQLY